MGKKRRSEHAKASSVQNDRDQETISLANELLLNSDVVALRKLAAIRGLVTHGLRSRVWPLLLGIQDVAHDERDYVARREIPHKDAHVVECDMVRSLWHWTEGWPEEARDSKREALKRVLDATIAGNAGDLHYYQGLHDVAAVLLFVSGEPSAYRMLSRLATCHLRDCTRSTLEPAVEALSLLYPILKVADPELYNFITSLQEPALEVPYFALSWHMTWFSHDVHALDQCARLFDLFISSHPLMPLYIAAVAVREQREAILSCGEGAGDVVYSKLKGLTILGPGQLTADQLAQEAVALYKAAPPAHLVGQLKKDRLHQATTLYAFIDNGRWQVPEEPRRRGIHNGMSLPGVAGRFPSPPAAASLAGLLPAYLSRTPRGDQNRDSVGGGKRGRRRAVGLKALTTQNQRKQQMIHRGGGAAAPLQGVAALTAMVFTGLAGAAFLGTTIVLTQLQAMGDLAAGALGP